jgi:hypothetical protein
LQIELWPELQSRLTTEHPNRAFQSRNYMLYRGENNRFFFIRLYLAAKMGFLKLKLTVLTIWSKK